MIHSRVGSWPHTLTLDIRLARDKHSSLLRKSVNYGQKSFITLTPGITGGGVSLLSPYFCKDSDADDLDPKNKIYFFNVLQIREGT